jgi:hypothetical protein
MPEVHPVDGQSLLLKTGVDRQGPVQEDASGAYRPATRFLGFCYSPLAPVEFGDGLRHQRKPSLSTIVILLKKHAAVLQKQIIKSSHRREMSVAGISFNHIVQNQR